MSLNKYSFLKKKKKLLKKKAESLNKDYNNGIKKEKERKKIFELKKLNKYKIQTIAKLPPIKKLKKNPNFLQYLQNTNIIKNAKINNQSPKNTLIHFNVPLKKYSSIFCNNSNSKLSTERKNKINNSLSALYMKNVNNHKELLERNFDGMTNSIINNNKDISNILKDNKKQNIFSSENSKITIFKHMNKSRSTMNLNVKKINFIIKKNKDNDVKRNSSFK